MTRIRAVLFDMDGVLIDAKDWHYQALNRALGHFGMEISRYDHLVTYDGLPTVKKLEMLSLERGLPRGLHAFINKLKQSYTMELVYAKCKPAFAREYALAKLKADGYLIAVCSNSIRSTVDVMMDKANLRPYLDLVLSNQDVTRGKPDPEMYLTAMARLGLEPRECLVVEDNDHGIKAAIASGAHLMRVARAEEVTYQGVTAAIREIEEA